MKTFYGRTNYEPPVTCARCGRKIRKNRDVKICGADVWYCRRCCGGSPSRAFAMLGDTEDE